MTPSAQDLLSHPDHLLTAIDARRYAFVDVSADTYARSAFLDERMQPRPQRAHGLGVAAIDAALEALPTWRAPDAWIAHTSFCASTLLATCLQSPWMLVLREPQVLGQLANLRRVDDNDAYRDHLRRCLALLGKRYGHDQRVAVKLSNHANNLLGDALAARRGARALLMTGTYEELCLSMLGHADEARDALPRFIAVMQRDRACASADACKADSLDLLQQTALLWSLQLHALAGVAAVHGPRLRWLPAAEFLAAPDVTMAAVDAWFAQTRDDDAREAAIRACFGRDAKGRGGGATDDRRDERERRKTAQAAAIGAARSWAERQPWWCDLDRLDGVTRLGSPGPEAPAGRDA
jgi:hypothetical protein